MDLNFWFKNKYALPERAGPMLRGFADLMLLNNVQPQTIYTDEHLKWDKPSRAVCLLIDLSVTLPLNLY
jgi:hypothetical protein